MASIYVGTYQKYNNGSIGGAWVDLTKFSNEDEFLDYCRELHKDEEDPEFMLQDFEGFPKAYYSESGLDSDLWEWLSLDYDDKAMLEAFIECYGQNGTIDEARDAFVGQYDSDIDFTMELLESCGDIPSDLPHYVLIDWDGTSRTIMMDYSSHNGFYFRA